MRREEAPPVSHAAPLISLQTNTRTPTLIWWWSRGMTGNLKGGRSLVHQGSSVLCYCESTHTSQSSSLSAKCFTPSKSIQQIWKVSVNHHIAQSTLNQSAPWTDDSQVYPIMHLVLQSLLLLLLCIVLLSWTSQVLVVGGRMHMSVGFTALWGCSRVG